MLKKVMLLLLCLFVGMEIAGAKDYYKSEQIDNLTFDKGIDSKRVTISSGTLTVEGSTVAVRILSSDIQVPVDLQNSIPLNVWVTSGTIIATQDGNWYQVLSGTQVADLKNVSIVEPYQKYVSSYVSNAPTSVSLTGTGKGYLVRVNGGTAEFNINDGGTQLLFDGSGVGDDFKVSNPTINVTSLTAGSTVQVYVKYE